MKRYTVLFFVLVTLLAVSGVSLANDLSWWQCFYAEGPIPVIPVKGYLGVLGTVGEYASIKVCPAPVSLEWSGKGYETQWAIADLEIKSNTASTGRGVCRTQAGILLHPNHGGAKAIRFVLLANVWMVWDQ